MAEKISIARRVVHFCFAVHNWLLAAKFSIEVGKKRDKIRMNVELPDLKPAIDRHKSRFSGRIKRRNLF